jgi:hypothetical protein
VPRVSDDYIRWFEITVQHAGLVRYRKGVRHIAQQSSAPLRGEAPFHDQLLKTSTLNILHDQEGRSIRQSPAIRDSHYARMIEQRKCPYFLLKTLFERLAGWQLQHFDDDLTSFQTPVSRGIDSSKAALTEHAVDFVAALDQ